MINKGMISSNSAETILRQLGGTRFTIMSKIKSLTYEPASLGLRFSGPKAQYCRIILAADDTYTMEFFKIRGDHFRLRKRVTDVYCGQLLAVFTEQTGIAVGIL